MYRTGDPRFRRRLNELGQTLEHANESAQSNIYIFSQQYIRPCFESIASCMTTCVDASCPSLNITQRDRLRRQRGRARSRGRAELNFDFYDDWDEDETDALMGWGNDEFDRLLAGGAGYGTVQNAQPGKQKGMTYPKGRRKSAGLVNEDGEDPTAIPGSSLFGKLFGGKVRRYKPSAAGLQEHPGSRRTDLTEGEALLQEGEEGAGRRKGRIRSNTASSGHTSDSFSSRGDIFPSDEELDDAIPLDDEFAMVLERRTTQSGHVSGPDTENSSQKTRNSNERRRGKRPSAGSRKSTRQSLSSQSSGRRSSRRSRSNSNIAQTPTEETVPEGQEDIPTMSELSQEERRIEKEEEDDVERKRQEAQRLAAERGLASEAEVEENLSSKEATPRSHSPAIEPVEPAEMPDQLPTALATDDESEDARHEDSAKT